MNDNYIHIGKSISSGRTTLNTFITKIKWFEGLEYISIFIDDDKIIICRPNLDERRNMKKVSKIKGGWLKWECKEIEGLQLGRIYLDEDSTEDELFFYFDLSDLIKTL